MERPSLLGLFAIACGLPTPIGELPPDGVTSTGEMATDTAVIGPGPMRAFSYRVGDGGGGIDPDAVRVEITTGPATCEDPNAALPCGGAWSISFTIPPEQQVPGAYELFEQLSGTASETGTEPVDCGVGAGSFEGTVVIEVVNDQGVVGRIMDADNGFDFDGNVEFDAPRCP